jgi:hypothetical protein
VKISQFANVPMKPGFIMKKRKMEKRKVDVIDA